MSLQGNEEIMYFHDGASLVTQMLKNPPVIWVTCVRFLGWEDPLEEDRQSMLANTVLANKESALCSIAYFLSLIHRKRDLADTVSND